MSSPSTISTAATSDDKPRPRMSAKKLGSYMLIKSMKLGTGSFAEVYKGYHRTTQQPVAVKVISRSKMSDKLMSSLEFEISILRKLDHEHIIKLFAVHKSKGHFYLVMEFAAGGDLTGHIKSKGGPLGEDLARKFLFDLALGLQAMQKHNFVHRDLKPQNLLLMSKDEEAPTLKIADFGLARVIQPNDLAQTQCGSPLYMAPENFDNKGYDYKADLWSVGVILYEMLTGRQPFIAQSITQLITMIRDKPVSYPDYLSEEAVDLLRGLLQREPEKRMDFDTFFNHPFLKREEMRRMKSQQQQSQQQQHHQKQQQLKEEKEEGEVEGDRQQQDKMVVDKPSESEVAIKHQSDSTRSEGRDPSNLVDQRQHSTRRDVSSKASKVQSEVAADPIPIGERSKKASAVTATQPSPTSSQSPSSLQSSNVLKQTKISPFVENNLHESISKHTSPSPALHEKQQQQQQKSDASLRESYDVVGEKEALADSTLRSSSLVRTLESCLVISDIGEVQFTWPIFDFSGLKIQSHHRDMFSRLETLAQRAWVTAEAAYLNDHFGQCLESLVFYNMSLSLLSDAFEYGQGVLGTQTPIPASERPLAMMTWIRNLYVDLAERAQRARNRVIQEPGHRRICPEAVLYSYGLKLAKMSLLDEYLENADLHNCKAMYIRSQIAFEVLLEGSSSYSSVSEQPDRETLNRHIYHFKERVASITDRIMS